MVRSTIDFNQERQNASERSITSEIELSIMTADLVLESYIPHSSYTLGLLKYYSIGLFTRNPLLTLIYGSASYLLAPFRMPLSLGLKHRDKTLLDCIHPTVASPSRDRTVR